MTEISATDAGLVGFRVIKSKPLIILAWSLLMILSGAAAIAVLAPAFGAMTRLDDAPDPAAAITALSAIAPVISILFLGSLVLAAVISAAANRAVLQPQNSAFGYLRLGPDELRQLAVRVVYALLGIVGMGVLIAAIFIMARSGGGGGLRGLGIFITCVLAVGGAVYLAVRLSLASAQTFDERRINIFGTWALTRGQFWPIFLTYLLAIFMCLVIGLVGGFIAQAAFFLGGGASSVFSPAMFQDNDFTVEEMRAMFSMETLLTAGVIAFLLVNSILQAISMIVMRTPPAAVYQQLTSTAAPGEAA